jgi:hypothetical protein
MQKVLKVSIIKRLKERYGDNAQDLRSYVEELVRWAGKNISFDDTEKQKKGPGIPDSPTAASMMSIIMPPSLDNVDFVHRLKEVFKNARAGTGGAEIIDCDDRPNEITLVSLTNLFPLRYVKQLAFLKEQYDQRMKNDERRAKIELHLEGDGTQHPRLFVSSHAEIQRDAAPHLLLAKAMNMVVEKPSQYGGGPTLVFVAKDDDGIEIDPIALGNDLIESLQRIDATSLDTIRNYVRKALEQGHVSNDSREKLRQALVDEVDGIKGLAGGSNSEAEKIYGIFRDGARAAIKILRRES